MRYFQRLIRTYCSLFIFIIIPRMTFIADERFQAYFKEESKQWLLQIKYVQSRDVGLYECQVSTEPKVSARAYLHVVGKYTKQYAL